MHIRKQTHKVIIIIIQFFILYNNNNNNNNSFLVYLRANLIAERPITKRARVRRKKDKTRTK
jgi:hypothetical protein